MPRRNLLPLIAGVVALLFLYTLVHLLVLRYQRGDVYAPYSTLRADPMGARALYEALDSTGVYQVSRGYQTLHRELNQKPDSLWYLGLSASELLTSSKEEVAALDAYVRNGGRVVITFEPEGAWESSPKKDKKTTGEKPRDKKTADNDPDAPPVEQQTREERYEREEFHKEQAAEDDAERRKDMRTYHRSLAALWGFGWERHSGSKTADHGGDANDENAGPERVALPVAGSGLDDKVPWTSALYFVRLESPWNIEYYASNRPVLMTRAWGKGTIVVSTDSFFLSNEALWNQREPKLIAFMVGPPGRLLFDETHLGTEEQEGVMALAEKFRLEGYIMGLLVVVGLFLWRNSVPLVPPRAADDTALGGTVSGKDSRSGLVNLLRRNIPPSEILKVSFGEWKRGVTPGRSHLNAKKAEMESVIALASDKPDQIVQTYHTLRQINVPSRAKGIHAAKS